MLSIAAKKRTSDGGFTLIELLVVVIIIGILAAIAIPVYVGQQRAARNATTQNWINDASKKLSIYYTKNGSYAPTLAAAEITSPSNLNTQYYASADAFCVSAFHRDSAGQGTLFGPTDDTWKLVYYPFQNRTSFNAKNPESYCVNPGG